MFLYVATLAFGVHHLITTRRSEKRREASYKELVAVQMQRLGLVR